MKHVIRALLPVLVLTLAAGPALADKLIVFKNGKVMRAKDVTPDGKWTYADLGEGATVGVRTADVLRIEDSSGSSKPEEGYNMASTENRGVSRSSGRASRRGGGGRDRSSSVQERIQQRQRELEEQRQKRRDRRQVSNSNQRNQNRNLRGNTNNGLRPLQSFNQRNNRNSSGFRRSRMPGGLGQRTATDQRADSPGDNDDN